MSFWTQTVEIARVDLITEGRAGETYRLIIPFAVVSLMIFPLALDLRLALVSEVAFGIFWALGLLFGLQVALRQLASDSPERRDQFRLSGVDPAARFVGRTISSTVLMTGFLVVLALATVVLFDPELTAGSGLVILVAVPLTGIGLSELGTIAGEVTAGIGARNALASLIIAPLALPILVGASQSVEAVGRETSILPWILLLVACDLALAVAGVALAKPLEEANA